MLEMVNKKSFLSRSSLEEMERKINLINKRNCKIIMLMAQTYLDKTENIPFYRRPWTMGLCDSRKVSKQNIAPLK